MSDSAPVPQFDPRISLRKLEIFVLVAELGSVRKAAEQLYVTQPVVTAHIQDLGKRVGAELFSRRSNRLVLSQQGLIVLDWAKATLASAQVMSRHLADARAGIRGKVQIAASMALGSYVLPEIVSRFVRDSPATEVAVSIFDPEHVVAAVTRGDHDFGLLIGDREEWAPGMSAEIVGTEEIVLVAPASDSYGAPGTGADAITLSELSDLPLVASPSDTIRQRVVESLLRQHGGEVPPVSVQFGSAEGMKRAVSAGMGWAFLFRCSVEGELARGELHTVPITDVELTADVYLLRRSDRHLSPVQEAMVDSIRIAWSRDRTVR